MIYRVLVSLGSEKVHVRADSPKEAEKAARAKVAEHLKEDIDADQLPNWEIVDVRPSIHKTESP